MNQLRLWQDRALAVLEAEPKTNQSLMAFTGSGKTRLALEAFTRARAAGLCDHLLIVTPSDELVETVDPMFLSKLES